MFANSYHPSTHIGYNSYSHSICLQHSVQVNPHQFFNHSMYFFSYLCLAAYYLDVSIIIITVSLGIKIVKLVTS